MKHHKNIYKIVTKLLVYEHLKNNISNNAKIIQIQIKKGILKLIARNGNYKDRCDRERMVLKIFKVELYTHISW